MCGYTLDHTNQSTIKSNTEFSDIYEKYRIFVMIKKIKITEEQAVKLFGAGYRDPSIGKNNATGNATLKMRNLGNTKIDGDASPKSGNDFVNTVIKYIYQINGGPVGIMDALDIVNKLRGKDVSDELGKAGFDTNNVKKFLDTLDIATIFSNYLVMDQPDYVYYRLSNLTPEEISMIKETYGKDFATWGTKCDGCGLEEWQTNVFTQSGDDAHINLEYMGSAGKSGDGKSLGSMKAYRIPFEIHHMNENPADNSPFNLSCLCPNCHSLTGSYGRSKTIVDPRKLQALEDRVKPIDTDAVANEIKQRLSVGHFEDMSLSKKMTATSLPEIGLTEQELSSGVNEIIENLKLWINKNGRDIKALSATKSKPVPLAEIGGREFRGSVLLDTKHDTYWVRLFSDIGEAQDGSSNFEGKLFEFIPDGVNQQKMIDQIEAFIVRTLTSTDPNQIKVSNWAGKRLNPSNVQDMSKEKDPEAYNEKFKELNGFDPHSKEKTKEIDPEKLRLYNMVKNNYENATTPSQKEMFLNLMRRYNPYN